MQERKQREEKDAEREYRESLNVVFSKWGTRGMKEDVVQTDKVDSLAKQHLEKLIALVFSFLPYISTFS